MYFILKISIVLFLFLLWFYYSKLFGAEYFPTGKKKIKKMLEMAKVSKNDIVYDLGCGTGKMIIEASKRCKRATGIEIDPLRFAIAKVNAFLSRRKNVKILYGNFFHRNIDDANVILLFLRAKANDRLRKKLKKLKKRTRIVSHFWKFTGWKPVKVDKKLTLYYYRI
ncbi:50S ribosomal protein L11 methyltransferase [Candidatus Pacearchaeota archaeon]|nr:50S ribosomal protein L11 methyltransferase [Candidatus Pacearchaeota archaeon]